MLTTQQISQARAIASPTSVLNAPMTPEQAKASYTSSSSSSNQPTGAAALVGSNAPGAGSMSKAISSDVQNAGEGVNDAITGQGNYEGQGTLQRATGAVSEAAGAVPKVASELLPTPVKRALGAVGNAAGGIVNWLGDKLGNTKLAQDFVQNHPDAANALSQMAGIGQNVGNTAGDILAVGGGTAATEGVASKAAEVAPKVGEMASNAAEKVTNTISGTASKLNPIKSPTQGEILDNAIKDATPSYSKKLIGETVKQPDGSSVPRVQEGSGIIKGRTVTTSPLETEVGTELSKVPGYDSKATNLEKYNSVQPELKSRAQALTKSLADENVLRPPKEIINVVKKAINGTSDESLLLQKSDPAIKQYMRVVDNAVKSNDGTLLGELKVRQALDSAYKNARGKMAFGDGKISVLDEIHTSARDALNQDLIDHAKSTDVKSSLRSQWNLNRAADVLRDKAEVEGNSTVERLMKSHPVATKALKAVGRIAGVGEAVHIATP